MRARSRLALPIAAALSFAAAGAAAAPAQAQAATTCSTRWGSLVKGVNMTGEPAGGVPVAQRYGHHTCFDRTVIDVKGPVGATVVGYVAPATGSPAVLAIVTRHNSPSSFAQACAARGLAMPTIVAPGCFSGTTEAVTTFVATRARLPFRVFTLKGPGNTNRIVVDVAHRW